MAASRIPATIDALVSAIRATGLTTWDGPFVTGDYAPAVHVGYDGDPDGDYMAVDTDQEWAGLGARARDEEFDVICCAIVTSGDSDVRVARQTAFAILATVENTLRATPSLGQPPPFVAGFKPGAIHIEPTADGHQVRAVFNVHVKTRI